MGASDRQLDLGAFLKSRRKRLRPVDIGLSAGARRHVKGLRREEVAELIGISASYYAGIEQGRPPTISLSVLRSLAHVLRLNPSETEHLFMLAGAGVPPDESNGYAGGSFRSWLAFTVECMTGVFATVYDGCNNPLCWNAASDALHHHSLRCGIERNMSWRLFFDLTTNALIEPDREKILAINVASLHRKYARDPSEGNLVELLGALEQSAAFRELWNRYDVAPYPGAADHPSHDLLRLNHPDVGTFAIVDCAFMLLHERDLFLWVGAPADDSSAARLRSLVATQQDGPFCSMA